MEPTSQTPIIIGAIVLLIAILGTALLAIAAVLYIYRTSIAHQQSQTSAQSKAQQELLREVVGELRDGGRDQARVMTDVVSGMSAAMERLANPGMVTSREDVAQAVKRAMANPSVDGGPEDVFYAQDESAVFGDFDMQMPDPNGRQGTAGLGPDDPIPGIGMMSPEADRNMAGENYNG